MKTNILKTVLAFVALFIPFMASAQSGYEIFKTNGEKTILTYDEVDSIVFRANIQKPDLGLISNCSATKTSIAYKINAEEGQTYRHTYIEGWYYEYMMQLAYINDGDAFDPNVVVKNLLADFGHEGTGSKNILWNAGDENLARHDVVRLVGGKQYYVIACLYNPETAEWGAATYAKKVTLDPAGKSSSNVVVNAEELKANTILLNMKPDENTSFFYYDFYKKTSYDESIAQNGQEWMENHLFEYGYTAANEYTDRWETEAATSYVLAIYGVDKSGNVFYNTYEFTTPEQKQEVFVNMETYERPDENHFSHECVKINVDASMINEITPEGVMEVFMPKATLDETLGMMGMDMNMLRTYPEYVAYIGATMLPEAEMTELQNTKKFTSVRGQLEADTEYAYLILFTSNGEYILGDATVKTDVEPVVEEAEPEYLAYVGEWIVKGTSSEDFSSQKTYTIRIEQDIVNKSFKVYGWGDSELINDKPFTARYDKATKKMFVDGNQNLGSVTVNGEVRDLKFLGMLMINGMPTPVDYSGAIYEIKLNGTHMSVFPNFYENMYEFTTMGYFTDVAGYLEPLQGDEFNVINFTIDKK